MKVILNEVKDFNVTIDVLIDGDEWAKAISNATNNLSKKVKVPGFREGHVPANIAKNYIKPENIRIEACKNLANPALNFAIKETKVKPDSRESNITYDITALTDDSVTLRFLYTKGPSVTLGQYKDLEVKYDREDIDESKIDQYIEDLRKNNTEIEVLDRPSELGDFVKINFLGKMDGVPFKGGEAKNYDLELGSKSFIDTFEQQLVGKSAGDKVDVNVTFPNNYQAPGLAGKPAVFEVEVLEVNKHNLPEIDDELALAANITGVATLQGLRAYYREELENASKMNEVEVQLTKLLDTIYQSSTIEISEKTLQLTKENFLKKTREEEEKKGSSLDEFVKKSGFESIEKFEEDMEKRFRTIMEKDSIMQQIITDENLALTQNDVDTEMKAIAKANNVSVEVVANAINKDSRYINQFQMNKLQQFLIKNNHFVASEKKEKTE